MEIGSLVFAPFTRSRPHDLGLARITGAQSELGTVSFEFERPNCDDSSDSAARVFRAPPATVVPAQAGEAINSSIHPQATQQTFAALERMRALLASEYNQFTAAEQQQQQTEAELAANAPVGGGGGTGESAALRQYQLVFPLNSVADAWCLVLRHVTSAVSSASAADGKAAAAMAATTRVFIMDNWSSAFLLHSPCVLGMLLETEQRLRPLLQLSTKTAEAINVDESPASSSSSVSDASAAAAADDTSFERNALLLELKQQRTLMHEALLLRASGTKMFDAACGLVQSLLTHRAAAVAAAEKADGALLSFVILFADSDSASLWAAFIQGLFSRMLLDSGFECIVNLGDVETLQSICASSSEASSGGAAFGRKLFVGSAEELTTLCSRQLLSTPDGAAAATGQQRRSHLLVLLGDDSLEIANAVAELELLMFEATTCAESSGAARAVSIEHIDASAHLAAHKGHGGAVPANSNVANAATSGAASGAGTVVSAVASRSQKKKQQQRQQQEADEDAARKSSAVVTAPHDFVFEGGEGGTLRLAVLVRCRWGCCAPSCCSFLPCFPVRVLRPSATDASAFELASDDPIFLSSVAADMFVPPPPTAGATRSRPPLRLVLVDLSSDAAAGRILGALPRQAEEMSTLRVQWCRVAVDTSLDLCNGICRQLLAHWMRGQIDGVVVATTALDALDASEANSGASVTGSTPLRNIACFIQTFLFALNACAMHAAGGARKNPPPPLAAAAREHDSLLRIASPSAFADAATPSSLSASRVRAGAAVVSPSGVASSPSLEHVGASPIKRRRLQPVVFVRLLPPQMHVVPCRVPLPTLTAIERLTVAKSETLSLAALARRAVPQPFNEGDAHQQSALKWFSSTVL